MMQYYSFSSQEQVSSLFQHDNVHVQSEVHKDMVCQAGVEELE